VTGHSAISLNTNADDEYAPFHTLTDALVSTFHHELFHNLQRSLNLHLGGDGSVDGASDAWQFFSEGTALLASTIGVPEVHYGRTGGAQLHMTNVGDHLTRDASSSEALMATSGALYWRFLYEVCDGMRSEVEDPAAGIGVLRNALSALYSGEIVDITSSTDLVSGLPKVMDIALAQTPACPFRTFQESLAHFARAIFALRLDGGRCVTPSLPAGCGLYDPRGLYGEPPVRQSGYAGPEQRLRGDIRTSYGTEFVDIILHPETQAQPLTIEIESDGGTAQFRVQVWKLLDSWPDDQPRPTLRQAAEPEVPGTAEPGERLVYRMPSVDRTAFTRVGLIITRVDTREESDPVGEYTIRILPG
jgi:hypothetical protein